VTLKYHALAAQPAPACETSPADVSVEATIQRELASLAEWLSGEGLDLSLNPAHADQGARDRLYWRYGYFLGLKRALAMLTSRGATLH
jgi:hypothetical protein